MSLGAPVAVVDAFDLPDWLGLDDVTWSSASRARGSCRVAGELRAGAERMPCDLLAVDQAYPQPVVEERWRREAHQAWTYDQVLLVEYGGRLTLAVPGTVFTADLVVEAIGRLSKAVGVRPDRFLVALRP